MRTLLTKFLILFFICSYSYSQSNTYNNQFKSAINFNENTNSPFTDVELNKLEQVYGSYLEKEILNRPSRVLAMKEILRNRVVIKLDNNVINHKPCPLLSEVSLFNAFVSNLKRD